MNRNLDFLNNFVKVSEETFNAIKEISTFRRIPSGTQLIRQNEIPSKVYMLVSGSVRCYLNTEGGKECNKSFYLPTSFFASLTALIKKKPSLFVFETLSDCKLYELDFKKLMALCRENKQINGLYTKILEIVYIKYEKRLVELISLNATERYMALKQQIPDVDTIIPQYHIASFLGITPVQLSRIRRKLEAC